MADYVSAHVDELNALRLAVACAQFDVTPEEGRRMMRERASRDEIPPPVSPGWPPDE